MSNREIRLSGSGGQGIILAAVTLADAAVKAGFHAAQTQSYGPEARGGSSKAEVILSEQAIDYPKVTKPDIFVALTAEAYSKYCHDISKNGLVVVDETLDLPHCPAETMRLPVLAAARQAGSEITANMVVLGVLTALLDELFAKEYVEQAINERVPSGTAKLNLLAFQNGYAMIQSNNRL